jgi:hypothetical protein
VDILSARGQVLASMRTPARVMVVKFTEQPASIRVTFNGAVDLASVTAGDPTVVDPASYSFLVQGGDFTRQMPPGAIQSTAPDNAEFHITGNHTAFLPATYKITLFGEPLAAARRPAISSISRSALDGEPAGLPSGDGTPGGDFVFGLQVAG